MVITKYTPPHAQTPSAQPLTCLYNCRARSTNPPYLKKQTQFQKKLSTLKFIFRKYLRPIGRLVTRDKANPNKPDLGPNTPPARAQNIPNLLPHNELLKHPPKPEANPNKANSTPPADRDPKPSPDSPTGPNAASAPLVLSTPVLVFPTDGHFVVDARPIIA